jgi:hypothetical protein
MTAEGRGEGEGERGRRRGRDVVNYFLLEVPTPQEASGESVNRVHSTRIADGKTKQFQYFRQLAEFLFRKLSSSQHHSPMIVVR